MWGHDKMRSRADLWGGSPLVSFNHVIDPHFFTFSSILYTTIRNPNSNREPNPNCNPTLITDPQTGPRDQQIVTVLIRLVDPPLSAFCRTPLPIAKMQDFTIIQPSG